LLYVIRVLRQAAWSEAIYAAELWEKKAAVNSRARRNDLIALSFVTMVSSLTLSSLS
jgi:hypothetical protein